MLQVAAIVSALTMAGASLVLLKQSIASNMKQATTPPSANDSSGRTMGVTACIRIFVNYLLMSGILGSFELDWGASLKTLFNIQQTASGGVPPIFDCMGFSVPDQILGSYSIVLVILIFPLMCLAIWKLLVHLELISPVSKTNHDKKTIWGASSFQFYVTGVFVLTWLIWPLLVQQALKPLDCSTKVDGVRYLSSDLSVKCEGEEYDRLFAFAVTMLTTVIPGFPLAITWVLYRSRNKLDDSSVQSWWFYLYGMYTDRCYLWEIVVMLRKFFLVATVVLCSTMPAYQIYLGLWVFGGATVVHVHFNPFRNQQEGNLELLTLFAVTVSLLLGQAISLGDLPASAKGAIQVSVGILNLAVLAAFLKIFLGLVAHKVRKMNISRSVSRTNSADTGEFKVTKLEQQASITPDEMDHQTNPMVLAAGENPGHDEAIC
jgi:hypothetical protein